MFNKESRRIIEEQSETNRYDVIDYFIMALVIVMVLARFWPEIQQVLFGGIP